MHLLHHQRTPEFLHLGRSGITLAMDELTSLSVASNAVQLADFMFCIVHGACTIYKSADGSTLEKEDRKTKRYSKPLSELILSEETVNTAN